MFNILADDVIRTADAGGYRKAVSLPQVYAALMADEIASFPALRPHQRHPWHAFLVQLGALAAYRAGVTDLPREASDWRRLIGSLTLEFPHDQPWHLVVADLTKPAFMQPPASAEDAIADYKSSVATPDELDMLVTSRNHDVKSSVASTGDIDDWIFALISLQTSEGFSGSGNYGISRMNGGLGSRPAFSVTPSVRPGVHVKRDVLALLERRDDLLDDYPMRDGGAMLVWTQPWNGTKAEALSLDDLDPFYIEGCRRIRLRHDSGGQMLAIRATSKAPRIEARAMKGITGDPWTPISVSESKSLTLSAAGFGYRRTADYLTSADWQRPVLFMPTDAELRSGQPMQLVARGMVRGQGKTEGYHERIIDIRPATMYVAFASTGQEQALGEIAQERIEQVRTVQRILRHAVSVFASGGSTDSIGDEHRNRANPWANMLDEVADVSFFDALQDEFEEGDVNERQRLRNQWLLAIVDSARDLLRQAEDALPCPAIRRHRACVRAESLFEGRIRGPNGVPGLFDREEVSSDSRNDD